MTATSHVQTAVVLLFITLPFSFAYGSEKESRDAPGIGGGMIMEHIGMDCSNCHGKNGPKGMMMEHEEMQCMICHDGAQDAAKTMTQVKKRGSSLSQKMMLEHKNIACTNCHGKDGPEGMMMEHEGIGCSVCHPTLHE